jgi:hypothetical protein
VALRALRALTGWLVMLFAYDSGCWCLSGQGTSDIGTAALEVRERKAHITATVRSAICVCDAVSVERLAAHDIARYRTIPHDTARYRTIWHDLARSTKFFG